MQVVSMENASSRTKNATNILRIYKNKMSANKPSQFPTNIRTISKISLVAKVFRNKKSNVNSK